MSDAQQIGADELCGLLTNVLQSDDYCDVANVADPAFLLPESGKNPDGTALAKQRFCLPAAAAGRAQMTTSGEDLRPLTLELSDTSHDTIVFELQADGLIVDDEFGSIGLIQYCYDGIGVSGPSSPEDLGRADHELDCFVQQTVREAIGLRHELMRRSEASRPYFVELVLVTPQKGSGRIERFGNSLRRIMRDTGYLHAIGVNVLSPTRGRDRIGYEAHAHRAFSWLLPKCRQWYREAAQQREQSFKDRFPDQHAGSGLVSLSGLQLTNFRLAGGRSLSMNAAHNVHIIHGLNGTGKSTFVDAVELLLTKSVARIDRSHNGQEPLRYADILTNSTVRETSSEVAQVSADIFDATKTGGSVLPLNGKVDDSTGLKLPGAGNSKIRQQIRDYRKRTDLEANSFRLEQDTADKLTRGGKGEMCRTLLSAFFPDSGRQTEELNNFHRTRRYLADDLLTIWPAAESVSWLKPVLQDHMGSQDYGSIRRDLSRFDVDNRDLNAFLSLYTDQTNELRSALLEYEGENWVGSFGSAIEKHAGDEVQDYCLDLEAAVSNASENAEELDRCIEIVTSLFDWQPVAKVAGGTFEEYVQLVSNWIVSHVKSDLAKRLQAILSTYQAADETAPIPIDTLSVIDAESQAYSLESHAAELDQNRQSLHSEVHRFRGESAPLESASDSRPPSAADLRLLDKWLPAVPPFSEQAIEYLATHDVLEGKLSSGIPYTLGGSVPVGKDRIVEFLESKRDAARRISELDLRAVDDPFKTADHLMDLADFCTKLDKLNTAAVEELEQQLTSDSLLASAVNELLALLTPARWAYSDVDIESDLRTETTEFGFKAGNHAAAQILNTAELNALAMAMFLVCAPRMATPLNVLLLDDPLQNMDELTVTAVARGLERLMRLWAITELPPEHGAADIHGAQSQRKLKAPLSNLRLVILLHGEENAERFRRETACCIYTLPWLRPAGAGGDDADEAEANIPATPGWKSPTGAAKPCCSKECMTVANGCFSDQSVGIVIVSATV